MEIACRRPSDAQSLPEESDPSAPATSAAAVCPPLYAPLALDSSQGNNRLLTILPGTEPHISCSLAVANLHGPESYDALSYVWGLPSPTDVIAVNGVTVSVGCSLSSSLRCLRLPDRPRCIWADAICINQQDDAEKSWQVAMMADIYRYAENVRVFVGDE
ncbi:heterokaryon incompatibility protein-domain-containing protein, partial [Immersiella caudata]